MQAYQTDEEGQLVRVGEKAVTEFTTPDLTPSLTTGLIDFLRKRIREE